MDLFLLKAIWSAEHVACMYWNRKKYVLKFGPRFLVVFGPILGPKMKTTNFWQESPTDSFFYKKNRNWIIKRFPSVRGHFALKCFLHGLIGQLVILGHICLIFTMLTFVRCLWGISYHRVLQWPLRITKKKVQAQFHPEDPFWVVTPMPKYSQKSTFDRKVLQTFLLKEP